MTNSIGKQIRSHRLRCSMTQERLAETLNVTPQAVSKWENSISYPDITLLPELSAALGITVDELFQSSIDTNLRRIERMLENSSRLNEENYKLAEAQLTEGTLDTASRARCLTLLADLNNHRAQMYHDRAADYAKQALELEPTVKDNHSALSEAAGGVVWDWCVANHSRLIDYYKSFTKKNPDYRAGYLWLMDCLIVDGRLSEAAEALETMHSYGNSYHYLLYKGWIAQAAGKWDEAEHCWNEMVEAEPENWYVWSCRGDAWAKRADYQRALADYRRAAELEEPPRMTDNYESIAQLCILTGDKSGAADAYRKIIEILRSDWDIEGDIVQEYIEKLSQLGEY